MRDKLTKRKGFTIIEVVIVLAIAALIIAIVLLAVQALQKSQRDNASKQAAGRIIAQAKQCQSDNGGDACTAATVVGTAGQYAGGIKDGHGTVVSAAASVPTQATTTGTFLFNTGGKCVSGAVAAGSSTDFAVSYWSDTKNAAVCVSDNG